MKKSRKEISKISKTNTNSEVTGAIYFSPLYAYNTINICSSIYPPRIFCPFVHMSVYVYVSERRVYVHVF